MKLLQGLFWTSGVGGILLQILSYGNLPEKVASHFNVNGEANGWMARDQYVAFCCAVLLVMMVVFGILPFFLRKMPPWLISAPRKDYWLNSANIDQFVGIMTKYLLAIGISVNLLLMFLFGQALRFNMGQTDAMGNGILAMVLVFALLLVVSSIGLMMRLNRVNG